MLLFNISLPRKANLPLLFAGFDRFLDNDSCNQIHERDGHEEDEGKRKEDVGDAEDEVDARVLVGVGERAGLRPLRAVEVDALLAAEVLDRRHRLGEPVAVVPLVLKNLGFSRLEKVSVHFSLTTTQQSTKPCKQTFMEIFDDVYDL